ncbi:MAG: hypothetical protein PUC65_15645 [Clostridiales bacterium]|nr:hypothetical protein [Clostridiales bacterium]
MRWRERMAQFMIGRYGVDQLNRALLYTSIGFMFVSIFVFHRVFYVLGFFLLLVCNLRLLSRNFQARTKENLIFTNQINKLKYFWSKIKYHKETSKTHHIYACPQCKQKIRVPKGKGKIMIRCPKCGNEFLKKS